MKKFLAILLVLILLTSCLKIGRQSLHLVSPEDGAVTSLKPELIWMLSSPVPVNAKFDLYLSASPEPELYASDLEGSSYKVENPLSPDSIYYWKVVAKTSFGNIESEVWSFKTPKDSPPSKPILISPANGEATSVNVEFKWEGQDPDGDKLVYTLYISKSESMASPIVVDGISENHFKIRLEAMEKFYWRVVATDPKGLSSESDIWTFVTKDFPPTKPVPIYPKDGAVDVDLKPTFKWISYDPEGSDVTFDLYLGTSKENLKRVLKNSSKARYSPYVALLQSTKYYWKVIARDESGNETESDIFSFTTVKNEPPSTPVILKGKDGEEQSYLDVVLEWSESVDPDGEPVRYTVLVSTELRYIEDMYEGSVLTYKTSATGIELKGVFHDELVYWRVLATDGYSEIPSEIASVMARDFPPTTPVLLKGMGEEQSYLDVVLEWSESVDPDGETVIYSVELYGNGSYQYETSATSIELRRRIRGGKYTWRVIAKSGVKETSSEPSTLVVVDNPPSTPMPISPIYGTDEVNNWMRNIEFSWKPSEDPEDDTIEYSLYFSKDYSKVLEVSSESLIASGIVYPRYFLSGPLATGVYYWRVAARDFSNYILSDIASFTVNEVKIPEIYVWGDGLWKIEISDSRDINAERVLDKRFIFTRAAVYHDGRLYLSYWSQSRGDRIEVYDVSHGFNPTPILEKSGEAFEEFSTIINDLIVSYGWGCVKVYDSDDLNRELEVCDRGVSDITTDGEYLFILWGDEDDGGGMYTLKVYDLDSFSLVHSQNKSGLGYKPYGILYLDGKIYVARRIDGRIELMVYNYEGDLTKLDITSPDDVIYLDNRDHWRAYLKEIDGKIFIMTTDWESYIYDPENGSARALEEIHNIIPLGNTGLYLVSKVWWGSRGIALFDSDFNEVSSFDIYVYANRILKVGDYLYVSDVDGSKVIMYDGELREVKIVSDNTPSHWFVRDNRLYSVGGDMLVIYDVSDPMNPRILSNTLIGEYAKRIFVVGNYAYISTDSGLVIYDVSDPGAPSIVSRYRVGYGCDFMGTDGNVVILGNGEGYAFINVLDKEDPKVVIEKRNYDGWHLGGDPILADGYAYVPVDKDGDGRFMYVYDVANPSAPSEIRRIKIDMCYALSKSQMVGDHIYMRGCDDFVVVDVSNKSNPIQTLKIKFPGGGGFEVEESGIVYISNGEMGIGSFRINDDMSVDLEKFVPWFYAHDILVVGE